MTTEKVKFSSQADAAVLGAIKALAEQEGRQFQALLDEALRDYVEKKRTGKPRRHVMEAFDQSLHAFDPFYEKLAK